MNERHEPTFFVDQNLIGEFVAHLRLAGLRVEQLQDHLVPTTPDVEWLRFVGAKGWVAITMDQLRSDPEEQVALMVHGVKVFVILGKGTHKERADFFLKKLKWIRRTIAAYSEPFMARLSMATGDHTLTTLADFMNKQARRRR
jgi:vacuolar-type H+-ATPase subunit D/Vma8